MELNKFYFIAILNWAHRLDKRTFFAANYSDAKATEWWNDAGCMFLMGGEL